MKRSFVLALLLLTLCVNVAFAYDSEYGDDTDVLPPLFLLNPLEGGLTITSEFSLVGRVHPLAVSVRTDGHGGQYLRRLGWNHHQGGLRLCDLSPLDGYDVETRYAHCPYGWQEL